jgi:hypothetical protein
MLAWDLLVQQHGNVQVGPFRHIMNAVAYKIFFKHLRASHDGFSGSRVLFQPSVLLLLWCSPPLLGITLLPKMQA